MPASRQSDAPLSTALIVLMAFACGAMVANLYYAQTLIDSIGPDIGLSKGLEGAIVTLTQLGYGLGLALVVPLGDLYENKRLILASVAGTAIGCAAIAASQGPVTFLTASLFTGICATGAQVLLPLAAHLTDEKRQGRTIGLIMSGLLAGIMLARPLASFVGGALGWRAIFIGSTALMVALGIALAFTLPRRQPAGKSSYARILRSIPKLMIAHRQLRLRAGYQAAMFLVFNMFWTVAPLVLLREMGLDQRQVALFALAGAGGALAAPLAGWLADRGWTRATTLGAMALLTGGMLATDWAVAAGSVIAFAGMAFLIDAAVQLNQITGQKIIFVLSREARSRVNAAYMTTMFVIGAMGSLIGSYSYDLGGWTVTALIAAATGGAALITALLLDREDQAISA